MKPFSTTILSIALFATGAGPVASLARAGDVRIGVSVGVPLPHGAARVHVGRDQFYYHHGVYYRPTPRGYVIVHPPRGARVRELPRSYVRVVIGGAVYYRDADIYYRAMPGGFYEVCEPPPIVVVERDAPTRPAKPSRGSTAGEVDSYGYLPVWLNETQYFFKGGQFFKKAPEGYVWTEAPIGAVAEHLPNDAVSVWHDDQEFFESGSVLFKQTRDGFMVVEAPWKPVAS